jgi:hypothetical protein
MQYEFKIPTFILYYRTVQLQTELIVSLFLNLFLSRFQSKKVSVSGSFKGNAQTNDITIFVHLRKSVGRTLTKHLVFLCVLFRVKSVMLKIQLNYELADKSLRYFCPYYLLTQPFSFRYKQIWATFFRIGDVVKQDT